MFLESCVCSIFLIFTHLFVYNSWWGFSDSVQRCYLCCCLTVNVKCLISVCEGSIYQSARFHLSAYLSFVDISKIDVGRSADIFFLPYVGIDMVRAVRTDTGRCGSVRVLFGRLLDVSRLFRMSWTLSSARPCGADHAWWHHQNRPITGWTVSPLTLTEVA